MVLHSIVGALSICLQCMVLCWQTTLTVRQKAICPNIICGRVFCVCFSLIVELNRRSDLPNQKSKNINNLYLMHSNFLRSEILNAHTALNE